tara:strand:+ start:333 stop:452 length:120 start_codon:yes stop_codon:yes gene_type:complete
METILSFINKNELPQIAESKINEIRLTRETEIFFRIKSL